MAITNNLHLLGEHFIQTGQLLKQWNVGERMNVGGVTGSVAGGAGGVRTTRPRNRARARGRTGLGTQARAIGQTTR